MCDEETCPICLDQLFQPLKTEIITRLQPCGHYYHSDCINIWTNKSKNCPTCRREFSSVETMNKAGEVLSTTIPEMKETEPVNMNLFAGGYYYSEDDFMYEEDEVDDRVQRMVNSLIARSNICILCDSRGGNVTPCSGCSSTFHLSCLGADNLTRWYCPMCDAEQINFERPVSAFRRSRNSGVTNRVYDSFRDSLLTNPVTVEIKENPKPMSVEEQQSWETFEMAKKDNEKHDEQQPQSLSSVGVTTTSPSVKKFKQPSRRGIRRGANSTNTKPPKPTTPSASKSLVETIVGQMKENRTQEKLSFVTPARPEPINSALSLSPSPSFSSSSRSSPQSTTASLSTSPESETIPNSTITNKSIWKMSIPNNTLTLSQKSALQEIVRNRLRPIYKDGAISIEQYTAINKKVSHILYDTCLDESEDFDFEQLADYHVTREIMEL